MWIGKEVLLRLNQWGTEQHLPSSSHHIPLCSIIGVLGLSAPILQACVQRPLLLITIDKSLKGLSKHTTFLPLQDPSTENLQTAFELIMAKRLSQAAIFSIFCSSDPLLKRYKSFMKDFIILKRVKSLSKNTGSVANAFCFAIPHHFSVVEL